MDSFLAKTAKEILKDQSLPLEDKIIVLPNKRAGIFLSKALVDIAEKPLLSPEIITIQDFIVKYSPWEKIEWLDLVFEFYQAYTTYYNSINKPEQIKSFDEFIKWAPIVLNDFEELDRFLLDPKTVFNYISEAKVLERWNLENSDSKFINEFKDYFSSLYGLYISLKERLVAKKRVYSGLSYRNLAENIQKLSSEFKDHQLFFIGFNALTKAEEVIIDTLLKNGKARIFWDADKYYLQPGFEAGKFLKKHKKNTSNFTWEFDDFKKEKEINIIETNGQMAQMNALSNLLKQKDFDIDKTAVVLNENALLFPLLDSLPQNIESLNVTLGIPITDIPLIQIFNQITQLFMDLEFYGKYKTEHVLELIQSPFLLNQLKEITEEQKGKLIDKIIKYSSKLIDRNFLIEIFKDYEGLIPKIFKTENSINQIIDFYLEIIDYLGLQNLEITDKIALQKLEEIVFSIKDFQEYSKTISSFKTLDLILKKLLAKEQIYFEGEPLEGLQILGLLETRLLDFEHIIMTSVNEGILPKGKNEQSIIPFDIKLELGLPTHRDQTSIMAYYFYRILQRAKKVSLIYNSDESGLNSGELSRFAHQISNELPSYNTKVKITHKTYTPDSKVLAHEIEVEKTNFIMEKLWKKASVDKGFGPTSLTSYIYDPISFLKNQVLRLEEEEEIIEGISSKDMGTIIHNTLEKLYQPYIKKSLKIEDIIKLKKIYKESALKELQKTTSGSESLHGKKHIAFKVILKNIKDIIEIDEALLKKGKSIEIVDLEKQFKHHVILNEEKVHIIGFVDRIDKVDGELRIIDYKTGTVDPKHLVIDKTKFSEDKFSYLLDDYKYAKIFQLLTYAWLYHKSMPSSPKSFSAGIISSRKYQAGLHEVKMDNQAQIPFDILKDFEKTMLKLLEEIFDPNLSFKQKKTV